ncbi:MAG: ORF6C domain-containing protein [Clostridium butyricum]|uniref:ORF6C domain-containing protein n=1 Tax=Clostridium sp. TaxID=1506 RepID=UPI002900F434|nr:ORF6C domain-containing protein [Clostridium sp.]MDU1115294.1 ORF6C domain-containing protein [Clostridium sp.]MDU1232604.1 ORF6C domain-containing protein [Clostridium sp.]MDU3091717.1 ORF6C domain-containing protein [Clostridium sp.]MDU7711230.1 ORF6C domain-containing protein [Clostridium butyricum]
MNNLMNFESKQVEVFEWNGQVLFNPKHVAECLDIKNVNDNISKMNSKQVIKLTNSKIGKADFRKLHNTGENFLTESGVYKLIFKSKKAEAERFQDWVTDEVLPHIRKTGSYQIPKMSKELEAILMIDGKQQKMDERITKLENNTTIDYSQQEDLRELANKKIVAILGGTDAPAYRELNKKVFSNFWRDYKRKLNVNSYKNTLVKDYDIGRQAIINWNPSKEVKFMIDGCNAQIRM